MLLFSYDIVSADTVWASLRVARFRENLPVQVPVHIQQDRSSSRNRFFFLHNGFYEPFPPRQHGHAETEMSKCKESHTYWCAIAILKIINIEVVCCGLTQNEVTVNSPKLLLSNNSTLEVFYSFYITAFCLRLQFLPIKGPLCRIWPSWTPLLPLSFLSV